MNITSNFFVKSPLVKNSLIASTSFKGTNSIQNDSFTVLRNQNDNTLEAELFADRMYSLIEKGKGNISQIEKMAKKSIPFIQVRNIADIDNILGEGSSKRYNAYTLPEYKQDCTLNKISMYVPGLDPTESHSRKISVLASSAHEFTHCLQRTRDNSYMGLKEVTNGNLYGARCLNSFSAMVFGSLEQLKAELALMPEKAAHCTTQEEALYSAFDCQSQEEFKKLVKRTFLNTYNEAHEVFTKNPGVRKYMPSPRDLRKIIKNQCRTRSEMEQEAYTVQKHVIEKYDRDNLTTINEYAPVFYKEIAKALE